jgi:hypothetical protein
MMKAPVEAVCGNADCVNNANATRTLVCARCGCCPECRLHTDCDAPETAHGRREVQ